MESDLYAANQPPRVQSLTMRLMIDKALNNSRRYDIFHPSAWGQCLRKISYQYYNEEDPFITKGPKDVDLRLERVFDNGHGVHYRWQQTYLAQTPYLRGIWRCMSCGERFGEGHRLGIKNPQLEDGWACQCSSTLPLQYEEITVRSEMYNFEGHVDTVIDVRGTDFALPNDDLNVYVVDYKTMKDDLFTKLRSAKHEHVVQTNIYMWLLDLKAAVVLYENKDNQSIKEMFVPRDDELIAKTKKDSLWLQRVLEKRKLPPRPPGFNRSGFPCRFCEFSRICYSQ